MEDGAEGKSAELYELYAIVRIHKNKKDKVVWSRTAHGTSMECEECFSGGIVFRQEVSSKTIWENVVEQDIKMQASDLRMIGASRFRQWYKPGIPFAYNTSRERRSIILILLDYKARSRVLTCDPPQCYFPVTNTLNI